MARIVANLRQHAFSKSKPFGKIVSHFGKRAPEERNAARARRGGESNAPALADDFRTLDLSVDLSSAKTSSGRHVRVNQ